MKKILSTAFGSALTALVLIGPPDLAAQDCLGNIADAGQGYGAAGAQFTDGAWGLHTRGGMNNRAITTLEGGISHFLFDNVDGSLTKIDASLAAEFSAQDSDLSICPLGGAGYQFVSGASTDLDGVLINAGAAVGGTIESDADLRIVPAAAATVQHDRSSVSSGRISGTVSRTYGVFAAKLMVAGSKVYGGPAVEISTASGSSPVFSVSIGTLVR